VNGSDQLSFNGHALLGSGALTSSRALVTDGSGLLSTSSVTSTELGYVSGASSNLQTQITSNTNNIATNTTAIGTPTSANTASQIVKRDGSGGFSAGTIAAALTGNASTSSALAANPADCSAGQYATTIAANGDLTCAQVATSQLSGTVTNAQLSGSIAASKLVGSDIATVGTITSGTWNGTTIAIANGGTGQTSAATAINALVPTQSGNTGKVLTTDGSAVSWGAGSGSGSGAYNLLSNGGFESGATGFTTSGASLSVSASSPLLIQILAFGMRRLHLNI
jgi:hypothetical protein